MTTPTKVFSFNEVTTLTETGPGRFDAEVNDQWTIGGKPNGGYLLAMLGRAASALSKHPHVIAASAHYLTSPGPGPVRVEVEVLRAGRTASQARARMSQAGKGCVEALITTSEFDPSVTPYWNGGVPPAGEVSYEDCRPLNPALPNGMSVAILNQVEVRLEPPAGDIADGQPSGRGELRGWLSLPEGEAFTPTSLLYAVDSYPPATFDVEFSGWVPTLELTVYVRALPAPGPVRVLHRAHLIDSRRVDESCYIWDQAGRLVAHSTQLAAIRLG
jgi:hypothetical protein